MCLIHPDLVPKHLVAPVTMCGLLQIETPRCLGDGAGSEAELHERRAQLLVTAAGHHAEGYPRAGGLTDQVFPCKRARASRACATLSNHSITEPARCGEFCCMRSGWFACTDPSLSTLLQGKQGVQGA